MRLIQKRNKYLLFDTIIIKKVYRKLKLGSLLMEQNNKIIKKKKLQPYFCVIKKKLNFIKKINGS